MSALITGMRWAAGTLLVVCALVLVLWMFQRRLIYLPDRSIPGAEGIEDVEFEGADGALLTAWLVPAGGVATATVVVFPGNAGNRAARVPLADALSRRGLDVVLVDYRGYGGNPGSPNEQQLVADGTALIDRLATHTESPLIYLGESLGAGVAVSVAVERPPAALILRSPFSSLAAVASVHYPWLPLDALLWDRYPVVETVTTLDVPMLVILGTGDGIVPPDQSRAVFDAAVGTKRLLSIEGADHNDFALLAGDRVVDGIVRFIDEVLEDGILP
jgi:uncharacterized protein